jgi:Na+-driven multidrug efflux pump
MKNVNGETPCVCAQGLGLGIAGAAWATTASLWVYQALQIHNVLSKGLLPPLTVRLSPQ